MNPLFARLAGVAARSLRRLSLALLLGLAITPLQAVETPVSDPAAASAPASGAFATTAADPATLSVFNRPIVSFHAALPGVPTRARAQRAHAEVMRVLQFGGPGAVTSVTISLGTMVMIDGDGVFPLVQGDLVGGQTIDGVVAALRLAVSEGQEARSLAAMLWRQVHAMMIEAAVRTEGILESPKPHVFQTALSDFYVEYRLVAQAVASTPRPRAQVLADLHANLQDVFNENGVQIMSPHYLGDPPHAKLVPPAQWNPPLSGRR